MENQTQISESISNCWKAVIDICYKQTGIRKPKYAIGERILYKQNLRFVKTHWSTPATIIGYYFGENHKPGMITYTILKRTVDGKIEYRDYVSSALNKIRRA